MKLEGRCPEDWDGLLSWKGKDRRKPPCKDSRYHVFEVCFTISGSPNFATDGHRRLLKLVTKIVEKNKSANIEHYAPGDKPPNA
jgi:hypothetical protein